MYDKVLGTVWIRVIVCLNAIFLTSEKKSILNLRLYYIISLFYIYIIILALLSV